VFGSNFFANFGIPEFPYQGVDPQGGALAPNAPMPGSDPVSQNAAQPAAPAAGAPPTAPPQPSSPLAGGPLSPMTSPQQPQAPIQPDQASAAPAAGIGSQFGKPANG